MAKNTQLADATVNGQADNMSARLNTGYLRIYDGTQPATPTRPSARRCCSRSCASAPRRRRRLRAAVITFNAITSDTDANATGTATWFRCLSSDGTTVVFDGSVDTASANLVLNSTSISIHQTVSVSSFTHDVKNATSGLSRQARNGRQRRQRRHDVRQSLEDVCFGSDGGAHRPG
jgi:hypothetical protein